ncbi:hypothetical protein [Caballeronia sp. S22]|uniref:hypothetical protein n=1 Tax=Caballeronia sp. S22 TaxID=3137182 RepID=UPI0035310B79
MEGGQGAVSHPTALGAYEKAALDGAAIFLLRPVDELHPQQRGAYVETLLASRRYMRRMSGQIHGLTDSEGQTELRQPALPFSKQFPGAVHRSLSQRTSEGGSY